MCGYGHQEFNSSTKDLNIKYVIIWTYQLVTHLQTNEALINKVYLLLTCVFTGSRIWLCIGCCNRCKITNYVIAKPRTGRTIVRCRLRQWTWKQCYKKEAITFMLQLIVIPGNSDIFRTFFSEFWKSINSNQNTLLTHFLISWIFPVLKEVTFKLNSMKYLLLMYTL